jgi:hypothetical protein
MPPERSAKAGSRGWRLTIRPLFAQPETLMLWFAAAFSVLHTFKSSFLPAQRQRTADLDRGTPVPPFARKAARPFLVKKRACRVWTASHVQMRQCCPEGQEPLILELAVGHPSDVLSDGRARQTLALHAPNRHDCRLCPVSTDPL